MVQNEMNKHHFQDEWLRDPTFARLSDQLWETTRRAILARLATGQCSVTELAEPFDMSQPAISKHLKVLRDAGLVKSKVSGSNHNYTLVEKPLLDVLSWLGKVGVARLERAAAASSKTTSL